MAGEGLNKQTLVNDLEELFKLMRTIEDDEEAIKTYSKQMADIIDKYIRSGKVVTTGTATNQTGLIT